MSNKLKIYLNKNKFSSMDLKTLIKINILFKPYYTSTSKISLLTWLEINKYNLNNTFKNNNEYLMDLEKLIPNNREVITKILGYRIENLYKFKLNFSRLNLKFKKTINIYWLELIGSYRGWRHMNGLPVRGQRTWTNAWSVYKSNLDLREFIVTLTKNIYKTSSKITTNTLRLAYMAEHINKLWSVQWELEWKKARKKRIQALKRNYKNYTVDLIRLASGNVNTKKVRKNRKKQAEEKKNIFYLGFDKGFTKYLLENNSLDNPDKKKNLKKKPTPESKKKTDNRKLHIIFSQEIKNRQKKKAASKKKKAELQAKKRKNLILKKKKKSVWD